MLLFTPQRVGGTALSEANQLYHFIELTGAQVNNKVLSKQVIVILVCHCFNGVILLTSLTKPQVEDSQEFYGAKGS